MRGSVKGWTPGGGGGKVVIRDQKGIPVTKL